MRTHLADPDLSILRRLVAERAGVAALPVQREKAELWRRLNDLQPVRPMVLIDQLPWHEFSDQDELRLQCRDGWARGIEAELRRELYQWRHFPADQVVEACLPSPLAVTSTGFGLAEIAEVARTDAASDVFSRRFHAQFRGPEDVEKIAFPHVSHDRYASEREFERRVEAFADIMPVRMVGFRGRWFAPWDELVRWWGPQEALTDLIDRPDLVAAAIERLVDAYLAELDQWEALGLLSRNDDNAVIGSGGYGYTGHLPTAASGDSCVRASNLWGSAAAQIFGSVSAHMHWEFALQYEVRWLRRFGLSYYGCCEPLDTKIAMLRRIPNLRKVSMSPWINVERGIAAVGHDYVLSRKPSPAIFAEDGWDLERATRDVSRFLQQAEGAAVEIILKDISTVRSDPERLPQWERAVMRLVDR